MERHATTGLPRLPFSDFLELNALADVVLDGLDWSGGVTALEAVSCGRLLVTLEGRLMRTRHTGAILRRLGLSELVAEDEDAYVWLHRKGWIVAMSVVFIFQPMAIQANDLSSHQPSSSL